MTVFQREFHLQTKEHQVSYHEVTASVRQAITDSLIQNGICLVSTPHTTCSIFLEEYTQDCDEKGTDFLNLDLSDILENIVPPHTSSECYHYPGEKHYQEVQSWPNPEEWLPAGDKRALWNGDAHIKASLLGSSETFPLVNHQLDLGKTGYIYFVDFDQTRTRQRTYRVTLIGE